MQHSGIRRETNMFWSLPVVSGISRSYSSVFCHLLRWSSPEENARSFTSSQWSKSIMIRWCLFCHLVWFHSFLWNPMQFSAMECAASGSDEQRSDRCRWRWRNSLQPPRLLRLCYDLEREEVEKYDKINQIAVGKLNLPLFRLMTDPQNFGGPSR